MQRIMQSGGSGAHLSRKNWGRPPSLAVAVEADAEAFFERFIERVGGLAERIGPG